jgi:hypothetical protein
MAAPSAVTSRIPVTVMSALSGPAAGLRRLPAASFERGLVRRDMTGEYLDLAGRQPG